MFTAYALDKSLPVLGRIKLVNKKVIYVAYMVQGGKGSLLGRRDGLALGIINIDTE